MTVKERLLESLRFSHKCINDLLDGFPAEKAIFRPASTDNHALWILGHLAVTDEWILKKFDQDPILPENYEKLFGYNTEVKDDPSIYPSFEEILQNFRTIREQLFAIYEEADDAKLSQPIGEFEGDLMSSISMLAWHDGWHGGQLSGIRRAIGLAPAFG